MYNFKIIKYANGSAQICLYDGCVGCNDACMDVSYDVTPFSGNLARVVKDFSNKQENDRKSLARTRNSIYAYARCASWEWFVTLTFDGSKTDRTDFSECMRRTRNWLHNGRSRYGADLKYLAVPELHADGVSWHVHVLLSDAGSMPFVDSGHKTKNGQTIYNLSGWRWGFSTATRVCDIFRVQKYIAKYVTKDYHIHSVGAHRFYASRNLPKPQIITMLAEPEECAALAERIADSFGMNIVHRSHHDGWYVSVTYLELL